MQQAGHVIVNREKILVLSRFVVKRESRKTQSGYRALKMRKSGKDGDYYQAESEYLEESPDLIELLKDGKVIYC